MVKQTGETNLYASSQKDLEENTHDNLCDMSAVGKNLPKCIEDLGLW